MVRKMTEEQKYEFRVAYDLVKYMRYSHYLTYQHYENFLYPSLTDSDQPAYKDPNITPESRRNFMKIHAYATLNKYGPSVAIPWTIGTWITCYLDGTALSESYLYMMWPRTFAMTAIGFPLVYFTLGSYIKKHMGTVPVDWALFTDLEDVQLSRYRKRLYTNYPETFTLRYMRNEDLRRFDGTMPPPEEKAEETVEEAMESKRE